LPRVDLPLSIYQFLYRSTTLTFQSQRTLRHLVRLLTAQGSYEEARRALELYVQLFTHAKETKVSEVAKEAKALRRKSIESETGLGVEPRLPSVEGLEDVDSDRNFADTLVFGVRFFCRYLPGRAERAVELADLAAKVLGDLPKDADTEDRRLWARVQRLQGISRVELAWQGM
jgi:cargo-transport protein YPP1